MRRLVASMTLLSLVFAPGAFAWSWPVDGAVLRPFTLGDDPYACLLYTSDAADEL